jgi:preprotein translocase subunit SecE
VAKDRQRAKQRQAERRARRQAAGRDKAPARSDPATGDGGRDRSAAPDGGRNRTAAPDTPSGVPGIEDPRAVNPAPGITPDLAVGAPPPQEGRSDYVGRDEPDEDLDIRDEELEAEAISEIEDRELGVDGDEPAGEEYAPRGRRREEAAKAKERSRVVSFLVASWAELQRVQWPDRQALTTLTGVVLGFVLIMGGYLGLLDAAFSRIINAIL